MASDDPSGPNPIGRAAYDAAFPWIGDALSRYGWREPAFYLVTSAEHVGVTPAMIGAVRAVLGVLVLWLLWKGHYWPGLLGGFAFSLLDTAGEMLTRCTAAPPGADARVLDFVIPPLWWWAWDHGLAAYGRPFAPVYGIMVLWAVVGGTVAERMLDALFKRRFGGVGIDSWTRIDSRFRLIAAGRNVDLLILAGSLLLGRPDSGLVLVAGWTIASLLFHAVRFAQATEQAALGHPVTSWIDR